LSKVLFENERKTQARIFQAIADGGEEGTTCELVREIERDGIVKQEILYFMPAGLMKNCFTFQAGDQKRSTYRY